MPAFYCKEIDDRSACNEGFSFSFSFLFFWRGMLGRLIGPALLIASPLQVDNGRVSKKTKKNWVERRGEKKRLKGHGAQASSTTI